MSRAKDGGGVRMRDTVHCGDVVDSAAPVIGGN